MFACFSRATASASVRKARQNCRRGEWSGYDHLQCDGAAQTFLPRAINDPHAATAEFCFDLVARHTRQQAAIFGAERGAFVGRELIERERLGCSAAERGTRRLRRPPKFATRDRAGRCV